MSLSHQLRVVGAVAATDIRLSLRERLFSIVGLVVPINLLFLFLLFALGGGQAPTAVVLEDNGPLAVGFLHAMEGSHSFIIRRLAAAEASRELHAGQIVAIVTVPQSFDEDLVAGRRIELPVDVNNLNVDFTNDIRRAVPLSITTFYAEAFPDQVVVRAHEVDLQTHDTGYVPYLSVSIIVAGLMLASLLQGSVNAARDYELGTIKELALSPASRFAIGLGKILGAGLLTTISGLLVLGIVVLLIGVHPVHPWEVVGFGALMIAVFLSLGVLVGTVVRKRQSAVPFAIAVFLPLFFLSGPFGPANWLGSLPGAIALVSPLYYAIAVFQHAFAGYQTSSESLAVDTAVLAGFAITAVTLSAVVLNRRGLTH